MKVLLINILFLIFIISPLYSHASEIDTINVFSNSMNRNIEVVVISPTLKESNGSFPVIYLLHGFQGNAKTWMQTKKNLPEITDKMKVMFVCPNGNKSWYIDSPKESALKYETFISGELIEYIDNNYPTIKDRKGRAITGMSMGGHGALYNAFRHSDIFGAAGSTSGGVDLRPFPQRWNLETLFGSYHENRELWDKYMVVNQINYIKDKDLALIIDCGTEDFFFKVNEELHNKLLENKISHDYIVRPVSYTHLTLPTT